METITIQETKYITKYKAIDGTIFNSDSECKKYEESAKCVLLYKYNKLILVSNTEWELFGIGSEDDIIDVVELKYSSDIDLVMQLIALYNPHTSKNSEMVDKINKRLNEAFDNNSKICISRGCEGDGFWLYLTLIELENKIKNLN